MCFEVWSRARGRRLETDRELSYPRVVLSEDMAVSWIALGEAERIERALQELPPTLRDVIDVDMVRQRMPDLRDPSKNTGWSIWSRSHSGPSASAALR